MYTYVAVCTQCTGQLRYVALHVGHAAPAHYAYIVCYEIVSIPAHFFKMAVTVQKTVWETESTLLIQWHQICYEHAIGMLS